VPYQAHHLTR